MNRATIRKSGLLMVAALLVMSASAQSKNKPEESAPSIEGTYKLVSRHMADGTILKAPDIMGMLTYTEGDRNFNVIGRNADGKFFSYSMVSTYTLSAGEYTETVLFSIINDQIGGKEVAYDLSATSKSTPVSARDGSIVFKLPFDPVTATFEGDTLTAVGADFTDHWEKVK